MRKPAMALLRAIIPDRLVRQLTQWRAEQFKRAMAGKSSAEIFTRIYEQGIWGHARDGGAFYSGSGSHDPTVTDPYVAAVGAFLETLKGKPDVVDLGCGDFAIGTRIRPFCGRYIACDIVPTLIEHHKRAHAGLDVDFRVVNLATDPLPPADVAMVRQVFQHMSNDEIAAALEKIRTAYRYLVLTEHVPKAAFMANLDKSPGADIRTANGSGVVVTDPPFSLAPVESRILCEAHEHSAVVRTWAYRLR